MAWRIHDSVIRGEIDNRVKGIVRGKLWLHGLDEPVKLDLAGHREGIDWIRDKHGHIHHPLQHRCFESSIKFSKQVDKPGLKKSEDDDLQEFIFEFQTTGAKLAGALNGIAQGRGTTDPAFTVAYLKRALDHLHKSQAGLERVAPKKLLPEKMICGARQELFAIREGILKLMDELRGRT